MSRENELRAWVDHLRTLTGRSEAAGAWTPRGPVERPFSLAAGLATQPRRADEPPDPLPGGDAGLWWAAVDRSIDPRPLLRGASTPGPLFGRDEFLAIEVWTETELCGLHALFTLARGRGEADLIQRAEATCRWHLEHTQPDNATNRPWALPAFLALPEPEARLYAETLLHNALAETGRPTPLAAAILRHSADAIEGMLAGDRAGGPA